MRNLPQILRWLWKNPLYMVYTILQTAFLPILLKMDEASGLLLALLCLIYTVMVILDAVFGILIFGKDR
jgi:hypothetical protein